MTRHRPAAVLALLLALALAALPGAGPGSAGRADRPPRPLARHVVLVDWDGFDPSYLGRVPTPTIDRLARKGSLTVARSTFHTISNPARASLATGAHPEVHGNAAYVYDPVADATLGQGRELAAETVAEALAAEGRTVASVQWYIVEGRGTSRDDPDHLYVQPGGDFRRRVDVAVDLVRRGQPDLLAVYASELDTTAHEQGTEAPALDLQLAAMDAALGRLVQATREAGTFRSTTFVLTSDHGMTSYDDTTVWDLEAALRTAGWAAGVVFAPNRPPAGVELVVVPNANRIADVSFRGRAPVPGELERLVATIESVPGVARVLDGDDLRRLHASSRLGDLVVEADPGTSFSVLVPPGATQAGHGSQAELEVPLLLAGAGVRRHRSPAAPETIDVAPTITTLLGVRPPADAQGRPLTESLRCRPRFLPFRCAR